MLSFSEIILVSTLVTCCLVSSVMSDQEVDYQSLKKMLYQTPNQKINRYLIENVPNNQLESNAQKIDELLEKESKRKSIFNWQLLKALQRLTDLSKVVQSKSCSREAYAVLLKNTEAHNLVTKRRLLLTEGIPLRRVDDVVNLYSIQHAKDCESFYPAEFRTRYAVLDNEAKQRLEGLLNPVIDSVVEQSKQTQPAQTTSSVVYRRLITNSHPVDQLIDGRAIYNALNVVAKHDIHLTTMNDERLTTDAVFKDNVKVLVRRYLLEPCKYYIDQLEAEVFLPAQHDALFYNDINDSKLDFYYASARYNLCKVLVGVHLPLEKMLVQLFQHQL